MSRVKRTKHSQDEKEESAGSLYARAEAVKDEDWKSAIKLLSKAVEVFSCDDSEDLLREILMNNKFSWEEFYQLIASKTASDNYLVGTCYWEGSGDFARDTVAALEHFRAASALDHGYAAYIVGFFHFNGVGGAQEDYDAAREHFERAKMLGCTRGCYLLGIIYELGLGSVDRDLFLAALNYSISGDRFGHVARLRRDHPDEIAPYSRWRADEHVHSLVPDNVHSSIITWLQVYNRLPLPRGIKELLVFFIVTRPTQL